MKPTPEGKAIGLTAADGRTLARCCDRLEGIVKGLEVIEDSTGIKGEALSEAQSLLEAARQIRDKFYAIAPGE